MSLLHIDHNEVAFSDVAGLNARYRSARGRVWRKPAVEVTPIAEPVAAAEPLPKVRAVRISGTPTPRPAPVRTRLTTVIEIQWTIAREFGITRGDVVSRRRDWESVAARQAGIWLCKNLLPLSTVQMGRAFGGRDHSTIIASLRRVDWFRAHWRDYRDRLETIRAALEASAKRSQPAIACEGEGA